MKIDPAQDTELFSKDRLGPVQVPAVAKAISIIRILNMHPDVGSFLSDIADSLSITRSHCHNILRTLVAYGWVEYDAATRRYSLSSGIAADSSSALVSRSHLAAIKPMAESLAAEVGYPCILAEPIADGSYLIVHTTKFPDLSMLNAPVGYRFPPGTAAQMKAKLAWLSPAEQEAELAKWTPVRHSKTSIMDRAAMVEDLAACRERGYARSAGEYVEGFTTVALPVFNREGKVFLILSVGSSALSIDPRERQVAHAIVRTVAKIHSMLDGRPPFDFPGPR
jgi:DNA-binding IclR family transcriptional regulator